MDSGALAAALEHPVAEKLTGNVEEITKWVGVIENAARYIAGHMDQRHQLVRSLERVDISISMSLGEAWSTIATALHAYQLDEDEQTQWLLVAGALAKFERNLIAGDGALQKLSLEHEPAVRSLIFDITTFARMEDVEFEPLRSLMAQLLCNMVSPIDQDDAEDVEQVLKAYVSGIRQNDVIIRLLDSQDLKTNMATLRLIDNLTRGSYERQAMLLCPAGLAWISRILTRMDDWHQTDDGRFELTTSIITSFISSDLQEPLFHSLSASSEPTTPSQNTLLKILDSYVSHSPTASGNEFLLGLFNDLSRYALISMQSGQDDPRLPKALESSILITEILSNIGLSQQKSQDLKGKGKATDATDNSEFVDRMKSPEGGIIGPAVDLLRQLDTFYPRLKPGQKGSSSTLPADLQPLSSIKRNLVQLIGILSYDDPTAGDLVREHEGVQLILSMTEVDESNPYLREHALFVIRNLMLNNPANQALIAEMDPVGVISESGELLPLPERLRRQRAQQQREQRDLNGDNLDVG